MGPTATMMKLLAVVAILAIATAQVNLEDEVIPEELIEEDHDMYGSVLPHDMHDMHHFGNYDGTDSTHHHPPSPASTYDPMTTHPPSPASTYDPMTTHPPSPAPTYDPMTTHPPSPAPTYYDPMTTHPPSPAPTYDPSGIIPHEPTGMQSCAGINCPSGEHGAVPDPNPENMPCACVPDAVTHPTGSGMYTW